MAYDRDLATRLRDLVAGAGDVDEKRMFGGLAFLIGGNMAIAASGQGDLMVRVDPAQSESLLATTPARMAEMRGRMMPGWLRVETGHLRSDEQLAAWVERGISFARSLPSKR